MAQDHYATLGLSRTATDDEIRKAYRKLARKYHPDLNPEDASAKKKFQEVQDAFDVLSDEKKRGMYDRYGAGFENMGRGPQGGAGPGGWPGGAGGGPQNVDVDLNDLFGGGAAGGGGFADLFKHFGRGGGAAAAPPANGEDIEHEITVPFATAILGGEASIGVERETGRVETLSIKIPAGIDSGKKIRLRGQGEPAEGRGAAGDLLLTVHAAPHPNFTRRGKHLDVVVPITLAEAIRGGKIDVPTPRGTITLSVPPRTSSGKKLRARGQGVAPAGQEAGDLYAEIQIVVPPDLPSEAYDQIAKLADSPNFHPRSDLRW